jgi:hypothetical protein
VKEWINNRPALVVTTKMMSRAHKNTLSSL